MKRISFDKQFPNSKQDPFWITSQETPTYNCIAWAFGDNSKWYWPDPINTYYWPSGIPRTETVSSFVDLYRLIGYEKCSSGKLEMGIQKIAIFCDDKNIPTHAARQLVNGLWTSKLGMNIDVSHTIDAMEGGAYGHVCQYMKRKVV